MNFQLSRCLFIAANVSLLELVAESELSSFRQDNDFSLGIMKPIKPPPLVLVAVTSSFVKFFFKKFYFTFFFKPMHTINNIIQ